MRAIPIIVLTFLLLACSGGMGGAPGGGGSLDSSGGGPVGGNGSAAQPLDPGFSGPSKDVDGYNYVLREAKARAVCKESNGNFKVRFSGQVFNDKTQMGVAGYLRISDNTGQKFQVTRAGFDPEIGNFSTLMSVKAPFEIFFAVLITSDEYAPLDVLQPFNGAFIPVVVAEPTTPLSIEENGHPCVEAASANEPDYRTQPEYDLQVAD